MGKQITRKTSFVKRLVPQLSYDFWGWPPLDCPPKPLHSHCSIHTPLSCQAHWIGYPAMR